VASAATDAARRSRGAGEMLAQAELTERVAPGVVFGNFHFQDEQNVNKPDHRPRSDPVANHGTRCARSHLRRCIGGRHALDPMLRDLAGRAPADAPSPCAGWGAPGAIRRRAIYVRARLGRLVVHPVQVVAPNTLANYASEVLHLTDRFCRSRPPARSSRRPRRDSRSRCRRASLQGGRLGGGS